MPMHDWTKVEAGIYHDFHTSWLVEIRNALNKGLLPDSYYALVEQNLSGTLQIGPDILTLHPDMEGESHLPRGFSNHSNGGTTTATGPRTAQIDRSHNKNRLKRVAVRHVSNHKIVALIELLSPGNKSSKRDFQHLVIKLASVLDAGLHLAVIDPFPPTPRDPNGIRAAIWKDLRGKPAYILPETKRLTIAAYANTEETIDAFVRPVAVGDALPELPLFYAVNAFVNLPLEAAYSAAWDSVPKPWQTAIAG